MQSRVLLADSSNVWVTPVSGYCFYCPFELNDQASITYADLSAVVIRVRLHCFDLHAANARVVQTRGTALNCSTHKQELQAYGLFYIM
jgi:hypothetical protein